MHILGSGISIDLERIEKRLGVDWYWFEEFVYDGMPEDLSGEKAPDSSLLDASGDTDTGS